jgi:putative transposase
MAIKALRKSLRNPLYRLHLLQSKGKWRSQRQSCIRNSRNKPGREGKKEVLGFWISETESASFWFRVLNDLKSRRVRDVLIFSINGIPGIGKAIKGVYPKAEIQRCVVHQIRNSLKYVSWKDKREVSADLRSIYGASTLEEAALKMDEFEQKWGRKYPHVVRSWRSNLEELMTYFRYPFEMRKLMYTTNIVESVNSKFRKVTDSKRVFPSDQSLLKSLYLVVVDLGKK